LVFIYFPELNLNQAEVKIVAEFLQKTLENAENRLKNIAGICTTRRGTHKSQKKAPTRRGALEDSLQTWRPPPCPSNKCPALAAEEEATCPLAR